ncbi:MAG: DUF3450 family protein [Bdellovibrionales bacterium]|nr:DUF3450 family protein [Bdellovibrionales bacterium]
MSALFLFLSMSHVALADTVDSMAKSVIELRRQTEELNTEYELRKQQIADELKSLSTQKMELSAALNEAEIKEKQFTQKVIESKKTLNKKNVLGEDLYLTNKKIISELKDYIENSLPYLKEQRIESVLQIEDKINKKEISAAKAANLLWGLIADEKRLAKETQLTKQNVSVEGKELLAEIVKVGMVTMYFKTDKGQIGQLINEQGAWQYQLIKDKSSQEKVLTLMDSIKKQIRNGYFELPMVQVGRNS